MSRFLLVLLVLSSAKASPVVTLDLAGEDTSSFAASENRMERIYGADGSGAAGIPVAGGFDCDGDGHKDYGFAQIQASPFGRTRAGQVTLVFGDSVIGGELDSAGLPASLLKISGDRDYEITGAEIWMDDLNGDGLGDIIIGRQNYTPAAGREAAGGLTIILGSSQLRTYAASGDYFDLRNPPSQFKVITFEGKMAYDRLGIWMRTGDVDGDGIAEIVVGADQEDLNGEFNRGATYVIRGGSHFDGAPATIDLTDVSATNFDGHIACIQPPANSAFHHFGATVQVGDLDQNGRGEVVIAATINRAGASLVLPGTPSGASQASGGALRGKCYIAWDNNFPPSLWPSGYTFDIANPLTGESTSMQGDAVLNDSFGEELLAGVDFSGDGAGDLFVGDIVGDGLNGNNSGVGTVFYNPSHLRGREIDMSDPDADVYFTNIHGPRVGAIGADTAGHGDFDGDGIGDLMYGNPHDHSLGRVNSGSLHIIYGQPGGWPELINLAVGEVPDANEVRIALVQGAVGASGGDFGDTLCYSATTSDLDGDGKTDLLVNEMTGNGFGGAPLNRGNLLLISGDVLAGAPLIQQVATSIAFSKQIVSSGYGLPETVTIFNSASVPVSYQDVSILGPDAVSFLEFSPDIFTLAPGQSQSIAVYFNPARSGFHGASVVLVNDLTATPLRVSITGIGVTNVDPKITEFQFRNQLWFKSQYGLEYLLQESDDLGSWTDEGFPITGTGGAVPVSLSTSTGVGRHFYRVRTLP